MKNYKKETVLAPLFKMLEACFELCVPLVIAEITDRGILAGDKGYVARMGGILFILAAVGLLCSAVPRFTPSAEQVQAHISESAVRKAEYCCVQQDYDISDKQDEQNCFSPGKLFLSLRYTSEDNISCQNS